MFDDRFDDQRYREDEACRIFLQPDPRDKAEPNFEEVWISERLLERLRHLGLAYELPLLSRISSTEDWTYPELQAVSLERELAFLMNHVSDPWLGAVLQPFAALLTEAMRHPRGRSIVVETPY
jgi:hypothetical protein